MRRDEHDAQLGNLDPSISPGQAEARKPKSLATEGEAQQQRVNQQGEQQRKTQAPVFAAQALAQLLTEPCVWKRFLRLRG